VRAPLNHTKPLLLGTKVIFLLGRKVICLRATPAISIGAWTFARGFRPFVQAAPQVGVHQSACRGANAFTQLRRIRGARCLAGVALCPADAAAQFVQPER
jgi:hypothetical protein